MPRAPEYLYLQGFQCASNRVQPGAMEELEGSARGVSLRAAACMLAGDARDPVPGERVRRAVDAQLRRAGVAAQDAGDVRTDVVLALLSAPASDLPLPLELVCARAAVIARNKAVDLGRRSARAPIAFGDDLPEPRAPESARDHSPTVSTRSRRRRTGGECAPISRMPSKVSTRRSARPSRAHAERRRGACRRASALDLLPRARARPGAPEQRSARPPRRSRRARRPRARRTRDLRARRGRARRCGRRHRRRRRRRRARAQRADRRGRPTGPGADRRAGVRRPCASGRRDPPARRARPPRGASTAPTRSRPSAATEPTPAAAPKPRTLACTYDPSTYDC